MLKKDFNSGWHYKRMGQDTEGIPVTLPHDAMLAEPRGLHSRGRHNIGWFEGHDYVYTKELLVGEADRKKTHTLVFEGIYHHAHIYVNGHKVAYRPYGYTQIEVALDAYLYYDAPNEIRVEVYNGNQPNSRWYTGSGIYRPVWLYEGEKAHIEVYGIKVKTLSINPACMEVCVRTSVAGGLNIGIVDENDVMVVKDIQAESIKKISKSGKVHIYEAKQTIEIPDAKIWDMDTPYLYTCQVVFGEDKAIQSFGIRTVALDVERGFLLNGRRVILKGACIHSDNQLLGAISLPDAEERRIKLLKELGYNAIRSAHNPASTYLLDACDKQGMLVLDEYVDCWYIHKTQYDYASYMPDWYKQDLKDMVNKDYNHPSVIMYSTGNEVSETAQARGIALTKSMTRYLHLLDDTRAVTCGVNIFFNFLSSLGFGVYTDEKAKAASEETGNKHAVGSEFYNTLAGLLGDKTMKFGATLHGCDVKTKDAFAHMDVAGYNYGIMRYVHDLKKYPDRLILGTETFCKDAYQFMELAKANPRLIGDFVWSGQDYIGEAGIGAWEYADYAPLQGDKAGWLTAGSGRLDITGMGGGEALYTKVALEKEVGPYIAVKPVYQKGKHSPSAWKMTDAMESWSWKGCDGMVAKIEVYAVAAFVELSINGEKIGRKRLRKDCRTTFVGRYADGEIEAVAYDAQEKEVGRCLLKTASSQTNLYLTPEKERVGAGGLAYIRLQYADEARIWKPMEKGNISVRVKNGELLALGNACSYNLDGYKKDHTNMYYGRALAIVRVGVGGSTQVIAEDETRGIQSSITIEII